MSSEVVVLANGCFDIFHIGHLMHLEAAKLLGDKLVVSITRNAFVNKGPHRPTFDEVHRARVVAGLKCVDEVILVDSAIEALELIKPDIFVKGNDYHGKLQKKHLDYCEKHGIKIVLTDEPIFSTTKIINDRFRTG